MLRGAIGLAVSRSLEIGLAVLISAVPLLTGCSKTKKVVADAPPPPVTAEALPSPVSVPADQPRQMSKLPPPQTNEVQEAVKRVFKEAVLIDTSK